MLKEITSWIGKPHNARKADCFKDIFNLFFLSCVEWVERTVIVLPIVFYFVIRMADSCQTLRVCHQDTSANKGNTGFVNAVTATQMNIPICSLYEKILNWCTANCIHKLNINTRKENVIKNLDLDPFFLFTGCFLIYFEFIFSSLKFILLYFNSFLCILL